MTLYKYENKKDPTPLLCSIALVHSPTSTYTEIKKCRPSFQVQWKAKKHRGTITLIP